MKSVAVGGSQYLGEPAGKIEGAPLGHWVEDERSCSSRQYRLPRVAHNLATAKRAASFQREHSMATNSPQLWPLHEASERLPVIAPEISSDSTFRNDKACAYSCEWQ
jgi:hypothetical protein